jgi:hypothetical protein
MLTPQTVKDGARPDFERELIFEIRVRAPPVYPQVRGAEGNKPCALLEAHPANCS